MVHIYRNYSLAHALGAFDPFQADSIPGEDRMSMAFWYSYLPVYYFE